MTLRAGTAADSFLTLKKGKCVARGLKALPLETPAQEAQNGCHKV